MDKYFCSILPKPVHDWLVLSASSNEALADMDKHFCSTLPKPVHNWLVLSASSNEAVAEALQA